MSTALLMDQKLIMIGPYPQNCVNNDRGIPPELWYMCNLDGARMM